MTKAATKAEARRRKKAASDAWKAAEAACPISGVIVSAASDARQRASQGDTEAIARALSARCALMGWREGDPRARDQRMATLYGRLALAEMLDEDAYLGVRRWDDLDRAYRRVVLGQRVAYEHDASPWRDPEEVIADLREQHPPALAVIRNCGAHALAAVELVLTAPEDWPPSRIGGFLPHLRVAGHALARHFGLRP